MANHHRRQQFDVVVMNMKSFIFFQTFSDLKICRHADVWQKYILPSEPEPKSTTVAEQNLTRSNDLLITQEDIGDIHELVFFA